MANKIHTSTTNIFKDLGFSPTEAANLKVRSKLMLELTDLIEKRGWSQNQAAKALGVNQPRISDLIRGKIGRFSIDSLIELLDRAGAHVKLSVVVHKKAA